MLIENRPISLPLEREVWIDYAKVIAITLVVLGHAPSSADPFLGKFIYSFHMPAFFCFSGYLFKKKDISFKLFLRKNIKSLIIPYLIYNLIGCIFYSLMRYFSPTHLYSINEYLIKSFLGVLLGGQSFISVLPIVPTWFLITLFAVRCVCFLFDKKSFFLLLPVTALLAIVVSKYQIEQYVFYQLDTLLLAYPFFALGMLLRSLKDRTFSYLNISNFYVIILFSATLIMQIKICTINGWMNMGENRYGTNILLYYLISTNGIMMIISFCLLLRNIRCDIIEQYSNGTMLILCVNIMMIQIIYLIAKYGFNLTSPNLIFSLAVTLGIMLILYYPIIIASRHFPFLLGK